VDFDSGSLLQPGERPVGSSGWLRLQRAVQQRGHRFIENRARAAGAKSVIHTLNAALDKTLPSLAHRQPGPVQTLANLHVGDAFGGHNTS